MNAIETLYRNAGLVTEDGYVKVRDGLWIKSGPYQEQKWNDVDKTILPTKEELHEIYIKIQELIQIQEACGLDSLQQILEDEFPWIWSSTVSEYITNDAWFQSMSYGDQNYNNKLIDNWVVPIRRSP